MRWLAGGKEVVGIIALKKTGSREVGNIACWYGIDYRRNMRDRKMAYG